MKPKLQHFLDNPRRWAPALGAVFLLLVAASWLQGPRAIAAGRWVVDEADVADYLKDHWGGPPFSGIVGNMLQLVGETRIEIELGSGGAYVVRCAVQPAALGQKFLDPMVMEERGDWKLVGADFDGGEVHFRPGGFELLAPRNRDVQHTFASLVAGLSPQQREFEWQTIDTDTLLWRPSGLGPAVAPVRIHRR